MSSFNFVVLVLTQLLCLRLGFAAQPQVKVTRGGTATVSGQVVLNGSPLSDVKVVLRPQRPTSLEEAKGVEAKSDDDAAALAKLSELQIIGYQRLERPYIPLGDPTGLNADGSFHIEGLQSGKVNLSLIADQKLGGFLVKRIERDGVQQPDGIEIGPGENVSNVRVVVEHGNLALRGEVKIVGGKLPPGRWIYANATRLNESQPRACGANVDARGQFIFENLLPGEYEVRLVSLVYQPGEPQDKGLSKLISGVRQKVSLGGAGHAPITLVVDLSRKEGDQ